MTWQGFPFVLALLISVALSAVIAVLCWQRRRLTGAWALMLVMTAVAAWSLGYIFEILAPELSAKLFWTDVQYLSITTIPVLCLVFALQYAGREQWVTRRSVALLLVIPAVTLLLAWTNGRHGLMWSQTPVLELTGPFPAVSKTWGPWFWFFLAYAYGLILLGSIVLGRLLIRPVQFYRGQAIALLIGIVSPWIWNAVYIFHVWPQPRLDLTPSAFTISGAAWAWALLRYRLLDLAPIARDAVFECMLDGAVALDAFGHIVDMNPVAEQILGVPAASAIGQLAERILSPYPDLIQRFSDVTRVREEVVLGEGKDRRCYDLLVSPLGTRGGSRAGRLIVWRDVTEHRHLIEELQSALTEVKTLKGLLPICASCKKIRTDEGYWLEVEDYLYTHADAHFSHSICPDCVRKLYAQFQDEVPED
jgi:PAS domain-containing protein